jgi:phosphoribosylpyrophosphate synthetase
VAAAHNIRVLPIAPLMAKAIEYTAKEKSVSKLFD